ncbi:hypothetical protein [Azonexus sp.]|uniref:hypothetical protein n=1 Tax=Azonexus sp. TaxID=1872668 RepID=UPI0035B42842
MFYVARDSEGRICEVHTTAQDNAREAVPDDRPELLQFMHERWRRQELDRLDLDFVRAIEDMIELLIAKQVILFTDLPDKVQEKLLRRREVRQQTQYGDLVAGGDDLIPL